MTGLIMLIKFRSINEIAAHFAKNNVDALHHFLRHAGNHQKDTKTNHWVPGEKIQKFLAKNIFQKTAIFS